MSTKELIYCALTLSVFGTVGCDADILRNDQRSQSADGSSSAESAAGAALVAGPEVSPSVSLLYAHYYDFPACHAHVAKDANESPQRATGNFDASGCPTVDLRPKSCNRGVYSDPDGPGPLVAFKADGTCPLIQSNSAHWPKEQWGVNPGFRFQRRLLDGQLTMRIKNQDNSCVFDRFGQCLPAGKKEMALSFIDSFQQIIRKNDAARSPFSMQDIGTLKMQLETKKYWGGFRSGDEARFQATIMLRFTNSPALQHSMVVHLDDTLFTNPKRLVDPARPEILYQVLCAADGGDCHVNVDARKVGDAVISTDLPDGWRRHTINFSKLFRRYRDIFIMPPGHSNGTAYVHGVLVHTAAKGMNNTVDVRNLNAWGESQP